MEGVKYLYHEPVKGDVYRFLVESETADAMLLLVNGRMDESLLVPNKRYPDGSYFVQGVGSFWPETDEWLLKYQDSLSHIVSQSMVTVYFVYAMKKGKVNTRAFVVDDNGCCFHTLVPTSPPPRLGESFVKLRMDLTVISLVPVSDILKKVLKAREACPDLI